MTGIILRRALPSDRDAIVELHHAALRAVGADAGPGPWDADLDDVLAHYAEFLVLVHGETLVGMGALRRVDGGTGEIKRMRVAPEHQGRGYGRRLLGVLEERARELGMRSLVLDTTERQRAAVALYTSAGFRAAGDVLVCGTPSVLYRKELVAG